MPTKKKVTTKKKTTTERPPGYTTGRPTKYRKEFCEKLIEHMSKGLSYESFAGQIDVDRSQLYIWEKKHNEFHDAKKRAVEKCLLHWEKIGYAGMLGSEISMGDRKINMKNFQTSMWIFQMKNRFKWTDRQEHKVEDTTEVNKEDIPTFVVEINDNGKFKSLKPRRAKKEKKQE